MAPRRSPRLHPRIQASEVGAGMARRRSPRLHPQIQASEVGAGVAPRRSPRLHPQIQASEVGAGMARRRRSRSPDTSPAEPASLPEDDDMLRKILLRLPPRPSSLPRASAVCKRWRGLVTDPKFHRQFSAHHQKPPLLGVFTWTGNPGIVFNPVLDPPDKIPPARFSLGRYSSHYMLDCRHGCVLVTDLERQVVVLCNPITGDQRRVAVPLEFKGRFEGSVLCTAGNQGHVHGGCHSSPFKVVLMVTNRDELLACVYSTETGRWGNLISTPAPDLLDGHAGRHVTLVGNALHWLYRGERILEFHLDGQRLALITGPPVTNEFRHGTRQIIRSENDTVGFAILSYPRLQMWQRNVNGHGVATWMLWKTIEMHSILGLPRQNQGPGRQMEFIQGYDEDADVIFLNVDGSTYMVQLMQSRILSGTLCFPGYGYCRPFRSFYRPAIPGCDEADMLCDS